MILAEHFRKLQMGDRLLITYRGRPRVAMVIAVTGDRLEVRPHRTNGCGWVRDTVMVTRSEITLIVRSVELGIHVRGLAA